MQLSFWPANRAKSIKWWTNGLHGGHKTHCESITCFAYEIRHATNKCDDTGVFPSNLWGLVYWPLDLPSLVHSPACQSNLSAMVNEEFSPANVFAATIELVKNHMLTSCSDDCILPYRSYRYLAMISVNIADHWLNSATMNHVPLLIFVSAGHCW